MTDWKPAMRVPDPAVRVLDERFRPYVLPLAKLERLATGCRWAAGPVWFGDRWTSVATTPRMTGPRRGTTVAAGRYVTQFRAG